MSIVVRQGAALVKRHGEDASSQKHFVFDLDETLGSFNELYEICKATSVATNELRSVLYDLLKIFPEFMRSGIVTILKFLHGKKKSGEFGHLYLYTNNQCGREWTENLVHAIEDVANTANLFDHIICAFKVNNVVVETTRTTHWKTWKDFIRCTLLPHTAHICFIDDTYFPYMKRDRVFYLQPRPYHHRLSLPDIAERLKSVDFILGNSSYQQSSKKRTTNDSSSLLSRWSSQPAVPEDEMQEKHEEEEEVSQRLLYYLGEFFQLSLRRPSTRKVRGRFWYHLSQKKRSTSSGLSRSKNNRILSQVSNPPSAD